MVIVNSRNTIKSNELNFIGLQLVCVCFIFGVAEVIFKCFLFKFFLSDITYFSGVWCCSRLIKHSIPSGAF